MARTGLTKTKTAAHVSFLMFQGNQSIGKISAKIGLFDHPAMCGEKTQTPIGVISELHIAPFYRSRGYGSRLVQAMLQELQVSTVYLHACWDGQSTAAFWEKHGFVSFAQDSVAIPYMKLTRIVDVTKN